MFKTKVCDKLAAFILVLLTIEGFVILYRISQSVQNAFEIDDAYSIYTIFGVIQYTIYIMVVINLIQICN